MKHILSYGVDKKMLKYDPITKNYFTVSNGCRKHNNCLTCPFEDCIVDTGRSSNLKRGDVECG